MENQYVNNNHDKYGSRVRKIANELKTGLFMFTPEKIGDHLTLEKLKTLKSQSESILDGQDINADNQDELDHVNITPTNQIHPSIILTNQNVPSRTILPRKFRENIYENFPLPPRGSGLAPSIPTKPKFFPPLTNLWSITKRSLSVTEENANLEERKIEAKPSDKLRKVLSFQDKVKTSLPLKGKLSSQSMRMSTVPDHEDESGDEALIEFSSKKTTNPFLPDFQEEPDTPGNLPENIPPPLPPRPIDFRSRPPSGTFPINEPDYEHVSIRSSYHSASSGYESPRVSCSFHPEDSYVERNNQPQNDLGPSAEKFPGKESFFDFFKKTDKIDKMLKICYELRQSNGDLDHEEMIKKIKMLVESKGNENLFYLYQIIKTNNLSIEHFLEIYVDDSNLMALCCTPWRLYFTARNPEQIKKLSNQQLHVFENVFELIRTQKSNINKLQQLIEYRDNELQHLDKDELKVLFGSINSIFEMTSQLYEDCLGLLYKDIFMRDIFSILMKYIDNGFFQSNVDYTKITQDRNDLLKKHNLTALNSNFMIPFQQITRFPLVCKEVIKKLDEFELIAASPTSTELRIDYNKPPSASFLKAEAESCLAKTDNFCKETDTIETPRVTWVTSLLKEGQLLAGVEEQELKLYTQIEMRKIKPNELSKLFKPKLDLKASLLLLSTDLIILASLEKSKPKLVKCAKYNQVTLQDYLSSSNFIFKNSHKLEECEAGKLHDFAIIRFGPPNMIENAHLLNIDPTSCELYAVRAVSSETWKKFSQTFVNLQMLQKKRK